MRIISWTPLMVLPAIAVAAIVVSGCGKNDADTSQAAVSQEADHEDGDEGHDLHGYWCVEHGVPEEICAQCDTKVAADFQQKGDWCVEHSRPDSQCFICHPEKAAEFAALYEAKFGEQPPQPTAEGEEHEHHDGER